MSRWTPRADWTCRGCAAWLDRTHPGLLSGPLTATMLTGGRSNLTYLVETPRAQLVLRRPPLGDQPATAHDVAREFRIITAARRARPSPCRARCCSARTPSRSAPPSTSCSTSRGWLCVGPRSWRASTPQTETRPGRPAGRHPRGHPRRRPGVDRPVRTGPPGRLPPAPGEPMAASAGGLGDRAASTRPGYRPWGTQLAEQLPATSRTTLVHGDFRLDNLILVARPGHPGRARLGDGHPRGPARRPRPLPDLLGAGR